MRHIVNAVLMRDGTVLLARRAAHRTAYAGFRSFPGGHVEPGETLEAALIREAREEIGITPTVFAPLTTIADPHAPAIYRMYAVKGWDGGEPAMVGDEHSALLWFAFDAAAALSDLALEEYRSLFGFLAQS